MGQLAPLYIALAASTTATIISQKRQAQAVEVQNKLAARGAEIDARSRAIARKRRLIAAMAATNVQGGVGGISPSEGSLANVQLQNISDERLEGLTSQTGLDLRLDALRSQTSSAKTQARLGAGITLFDAAFKAGELGKPN